MAKDGSVAPQERVNITYKASTGDAQEEVELPLKLLFMGDYTSRPDSRPIEERKPISVDKDNFQKVLGEQNLGLTMSVPDKLSDKADSNISVSLKFKSLADFSPEGVATQVPELKKLLDEGQAGDNVGCLLRGIERDEIERGQVLAKAGSIKPHTKFSAQVYVLTKEEGGRHTPFYNGYRPQFYLRTTDVTGAIGLPHGAEMIMPGDNVEMTVELITPIALEVGQRFAIREGGRTVGAGAITSIAE